MLPAIRPANRRRDIVFIHDVTHPYVDEAHLEELSAAAAAHGGATMGECQYDTVFCWAPKKGTADAMVGRT